jgi:hypothetical protein
MMALEPSMQALACSVQPDSSRLFEEGAPGQGLTVRLTDKTEIEARSGHLPGEHKIQLMQTHHPNPWG